MGRLGVPGNLPAELSTFVGRADDLERGARLLGESRQWLTEYLLARVHCGNEFHNASRRQVLLVDPHAEG